MKTLIVTLTTLAALLSSTHAQTSSGSLFVGGPANIYGAYGMSLGEWFSTAPPAPGGGTGGVWPSSFSFSAKPNQVVLFTNITGQISLTSGVGELNGADGNASIATDMSSYSGVSGIQSDSSGFLVGVFLDSNERRDPPAASLDFRSSGLGTSFVSLAPEIGQLFFIGDGLTGTGSGEIQQFIVPPTATGLYLGFADGESYMGLPGQYQDNVGNLIANLRLVVVPEPSGLSILGLGAVLLLRARQSSQNA